MVLRLYKYFFAFVFCNITAPRLSSALLIANDDEGNVSKNFSLLLCIHQMFYDNPNDRE